jgi:hypothetical protein
MTCRKYIYVIDGHMFLSFFRQIVLGYILFFPFHVMLWGLILSFQPLNQNNVAICDWVTITNHIYTISINYFLSNYNFACRVVYQKYSVKLKSMTKVLCLLLKIFRHIKKNYIVMGGLMLRLGVIIAILVLFFK